MIFREKGFTLIEILLVLIIIMLIIIPLLHFMLTYINIWDKIIQKNDLKQQARIITILLEKDIKHAIDFKIEDRDNDGYEELYLNLGELVLKKDSTDKDTNYYIQYKINEGILSYCTLKSKHNDSGISYPGWPDDNNWGYSRPVTVSLISDYFFTEIEDKVLFEINLKKDNAQLVIKNIISPITYRRIIRY
ncbi:MAG: prepilin-type N-terminal cleavage/methylation domain-containing protein [Halanaerobiaceae bacterium]